MQYKQCFTENNAIQEGPQQHNVQTDYNLKTEMFLQRYLDAFDCDAADDAGITAPTATHFYNLVTA